MDTGRAAFERMAGISVGVAGVGAYLPALAAHGGKSTTRAIANTLRCSAQKLSWVRQDLIREGDIYAPQRGHVSLTAPILGPYILAHYKRARAGAETPLLSLTELQPPGGD